MTRQKEKYRQFRKWQRQPYQVAPLSEEMHECATCGTIFEGNYCPRCGQSAMIERYSFKRAFLLFLDVWGMGNRGMFRSIRDLLLRPGYMIRDYLGGMQMAYFPPFKMFFLFFALLFLVDTGLNIKGINRMVKNEEQVQVFANEVTSKITTQDDRTETQGTKTTVESDRKDIAKTENYNKSKQVDDEVARIGRKLKAWSDNNVSFMNLILVLLYAWPLWLLIRHCPTIPDLRLSECIVAMVYISNMLCIYSLIPSFLCFSLKAETIYGILTLLLVIIPIKQLSGYSYWDTIWRLLVAIIPFIFLLLFLLAIGCAVVFIYAYFKFI